MNGWFLAAGILLAAAFFVHLVSGNRLYSCARPEKKSVESYTAWLMGRCGMQLIAVDLALGAVFALLLGTGAIARNFPLELFLTLTFAGWFAGWLVSLGFEKASANRYVRLCHWVLFLILAVLMCLGMRHE